MRGRGSSGSANSHAYTNGGQSTLTTLLPIHSPAMVRIGSKTKLLLSPDGRSVQLAPEAPKSLSFSPTKALVADSTSTSPIFRQDVRIEWIAALFGPNFLKGPNGMDGNANGNGNRNVVGANPSDELDAYTVPRTGVGLAKIPQYLSYVTTIPKASTVTGTPAVTASTTNGSPTSDTTTSSTPASETKIGITLSRIPLGVYVRMVDVDSEAYHAGIVPGSVLVSINSMGVLGEPSHKLLERLWMYEGHFTPQQNNNTSSNSEDSNMPRTNSILESTPSKWQGPLVLTLIKDGHLYTITLLTCSPFGISWAPCANFALVQRTYAHAASAGVKRGCLVAAVNDGNFWSMDHLDTAMKLKEEYSKNQSITLVCVYTPAASRTGFAERKEDSNKNQEYALEGGVKIRKRFTKRKPKVQSQAQPWEETPTEYGVGSFFSCGTGVNYIPVSGDQESSVRNGPPHNIVSELANRVAAGEIPAPTGMKRGMSFSSDFEGRGRNAAHTFDSLTQLRVSPMKKGDGTAWDGAELKEAVSRTAMLAQKQQQLQRRKGAMEGSYASLYKLYGDCPTLEWSAILPQWDVLGSIVYNLRLHASNYNHVEFYKMGGVLGVMGGEMDGLLSVMEDTKDEGVEDKQGQHVPLHTMDANVRLIREICYSENGGQVLCSNVLQLVGILASRDIFQDVVETIVESSESKMDEALRAKAVIVTTGVLEEVMESLVEAAIHDDELCQNLHFLLRSFSSMYAKQDPMGTDKDANFSPMKMLTAAHRLLRTRILEREEAGEDISVAQSISMDSRTHSVRSMPSGESTGIEIQVGGEDTLEQAPPKKKMGKKIRKLFRTKSKSSQSKPTYLESKSISLPSDGSGFLDTCESSSSRDGGNINSNVPNSSPPPRYPSRKKFVGLRPMSILRKAADQEPQVEHIDERDALSNLPVIYSPPMSKLFENMGWFLSNLDGLCGNIERSLLKSFSKKITEWALQPWSPNKDRALTEGTADMRKGLGIINRQNEIDAESKTNKWSPVLNPVDPSEMLLSLVPEQSYILPSAHFPILLTFNSCPREVRSLGITSVQSDATESGYNQQATDVIYRTRIDFVAVRGDSKSDKALSQNTESPFIVHADVAGDIQKTGRSVLEPYYESSTHRWHEANSLLFETTVGCPTTVSLRLSSASLNEDGSVTDNESNTSEIGYSWLDISHMWKNVKRGRIVPSVSTMNIQVYSYNMQDDFDQGGFLPGDLKHVPQLTIEVQITTEAIPMHPMKPGCQPKRMLLYKHDEDIRQEMLATQFVGLCDSFLRASGLDLKFKDYRCIPVGENKGFIEWVPGTFSLSEICKPIGSSLNSSSGGNHRSKAAKKQVKGDGSNNDEGSKAFERQGAWCKFESLRSLRQTTQMPSRECIGLSGENPIQDFLRSNAFDENAAYFIRKNVMENYIKSCAGYSVVTYLLGVGDRHTDNLLLHRDGYFLHCDYSFILGQDPKTYMPMRINEQMVNGMGGKDSDNFAMFLSLAGAAFVALRQHSCVRALLSIIRNVTDLQIPDASVNQTSESAISSMRQRLRLDLNDDEAVTFIEEIIEQSLTSKMWVAVDAIHSLGKRF